MIRLLEAVLTKSNAGEGVVDKNKLLQWLEQPCLTATKTFNCVMCWRRLPMSQSLRAGPAATKPCLGRSQYMQTKAMVSNIDVTLPEGWQLSCALLLYGVL